MILRGVRKRIVAEPLGPMWPYEGMWTRNFGIEEGGLYLVMAIWFQTGRLGFQVAIPGLIPQSAPGECFEIVEDSLPAFFVFQSRPDGWFFGHPALGDEDFVQDLIDDDEEAQGRYRVAMQEVAAAQEPPRTGSSTGPLEGIPSEWLAWDQDIPQQDAPLG